MERRLKRRNESYKNWVIASSCGLNYKVSIYEGKEDTTADKVPLGTRTVMECLSVCDNPASHHIYFDHYFTSYDLVAKISCGFVLCFEEISYQLCVRICLKKIIMSLDEFLLTSIQVFSLQ